jgi:hypothetical protein
MFSCGTEQGCHLLLSAGLDYVTLDDSDVGEVFDATEGANQKYARLQVWFAEDLDLAIVSRAISPQIKNSDEAKVVIRQGPTDTGCRCNSYASRSRNSAHIRQVSGAGALLNCFTTTRVS